MSEYQIRKDIDKIYTDMNTEIENLKKRVTELEKKLKEMENGI